MSTDSVTPVTPPHTGGTPILSSPTKDIELKDMSVKEGRRGSIPTVAAVDVNPVERYDSESDHESSSIKKKQKKKFWCTITKVDIILLAVAIFLVCLGLAVGLISFFLLQNSEVQDAARDIQVIAALNAASFKKALDDTIRSVTAVQAVFMYSNGTLSEKQYTPFMDSAGLFTNRFLNINYLRIVNDADRDTFEQQQRQQGGPYANYQIRTKLADGTFVPSPRNPTYKAVTHIYPTFDSFILGYDQSSDAQKNKTINRMLLTKSLTMTERVNIITSNQTIPGAMIMAPISINGIITSYVLGSINPQAVINGSMDYTDTKNLIVGVIDANNTSPNFADIVMCSTLTDAQARASFGVDAAKVTPEMIDEVTRASPFPAPGIPINAVDRTWIVHFIPTRNFINSYQSYQKWVALFVSLVGGILLAGMIAFFTKRVQYAQYVRAITREQVQILESSQSKLHSLLNKIAVRERKTRGTIDAIPDMIFTVNHLGRVLQTNASFDKVLMYGSNELEKGLYVDRVFPNLENMFFLRQNSVESMDTDAATKDGDRVKVQVTVRNLIFSRKDKLSSTDSHAATTRDKESIETSVTSKDEIEAFVIVARNMTDREKLLEDMMKREQLYQDRLKLVDFDTQFKLATFQKNFKKYCKQLPTQKSSDALDLFSFLEIVQGFKKSPFEQRMNQQNQLFEMYMKPDAPAKLSVMDEKLTAQVSLRVTKSVGDHDVFDDVEYAVKKKIVTDYYPGYVALHPEEESNSRSTHSSDEITTVTDTNTITTSGEHTDR